MSVLQNEATSGYNPATGGLWVNWVTASDGTVTGNYNGTGLPDAPSSAPRHDPATDLRFLHNLLTYQSQHPTDTQFAGTIAQYTALIKSEFAATHDKRGWYYDELVAIGQLSADPWFASTADSLAASYAKQYKPQFGMIFEQSSRFPTGFYRVDWALQEGAVLVEAGVSDQNPAWVAEGKSVLNFVRTHAYLSSQNVYLHAMTDVVLSDGSANPNETISFTTGTGSNGALVQAGETAQDATALLEAGGASGDASLVAEGEQLLNAFTPQVNTLGLWDPTSQGYFENGSFNGTSFDSPGSFVLEAGKKDAGRQLTMLGAYHLADSLLPSKPFQSMEQTLTSVALMAYNADQHGYTYEQRSNWSPVVISSCGCSEIWVTSEADGIALEALQALGS